jgi:hypothetical protein
MNVDGYVGDDPLVAEVAERAMEERNGVEDQAFDRQMSDPTAIALTVAASRRR